MATGEITIITFAGLSLITLVVFFWMASRGWSSGSQPLAKIRVRSNDHLRRPTPPLDENNDTFRIPDWILGVLILMVVITTVLAASTHP